MRFVALTAGVLASTGAAACPGLAVENGWIREAPPGAMSAAYARLTNRGKQPLVVDGARSADFGGAGLHRTVIDERGVAGMREGSLALAPGASATLEAGDWHLMLYEPNRLLKAGDTVTLALTCGGAAREFVFTVKAVE
ncbi:MAG: copper chaperone PCu(A)C [Gammaproteobacteria bacterium]